MLDDGGMIEQAAEFALDHVAIGSISGFLNERVPFGSVAADRYRAEALLDHPPDVA